MIFVFMNLFYLETTSDYITPINGLKGEIVRWDSWVLRRAFCYNKCLFTGDVQTGRGIVLRKESWKVLCRADAGRSSEISKRPMTP
jgi:hypothetical protein